MHFERIEFDDILPYWQQMPNMSLEPMSYMRLSGGYHNADEIFEPIFYVLKEGKTVIGCNSIHMTGVQYRSRGLWVNPEYRKQGFGSYILKYASVLVPIAGVYLWSYPSNEALSVYKHAGFSMMSNDGTHNYVIRLVRGADHE